MKSILTIIYDSEKILFIFRISEARCDAERDIAQKRKNQKLRLLVFCFEHSGVFCGRK